jgi:ABC-type multidrug transport system permease subunit
MSKLLEIIKKNLKLLIRSKSSALIVLLGPLALMLLIGLAFNTSSLFDIKVGTFSQGYSELSNSIIEKLQDKQFNVIKIDSEEKCIDMIKTGAIHVCTIFPKDLTVKTSDKIVFYVDKSRINFVYIILDKISSKITTKSTELSTALTNRLITTINNADSKLTSTKTLSNELENSKSGVNNVVNEISNINTTIVELNFTKLNEGVKDLESKNNLSTGSWSSLKTIINDFKTQYDVVSTQITTIASIKDSTTKNLNDVSVKLSTNINDAKTNEASLKEIKDDISSIEIKDVSRIVSPVTTEIKPISAESTNLNYTFPTLVVLILLFAGLLLASTTIVEEKSSKAYFRNFITPTSDLVFIFGNYISSVAIIFAQLVIIFLVMFKITNSSLIFNTILNAFIVLILLGSVFILMGMLIGYMFKSGETSNIAAISLGSILLFFSNTILPIETLPASIRSIVQFNPYIVGEAALKKILLFNQSLSNVLPQIYTLIAYVSALFILVFLFRELTKNWFTNNQ